MFDEILVPLDGSELAEKALEPALTLARGRAGRIVLVDVPVYHQGMAPGAAGYGVFATDHSFDLDRAEAKRYLDGVIRAHSQPGITMRPLVVDGDVAGSIVDTAVEEGVDLIIMTT